MKRALVTGGTGNIGAFVVEQLRKTGWEVVSTTRQKNAGDGCITADLTDPSQAIHVFQGRTFDVVIHTAAPVYNADTYRKDPYGVFRDDLSCLLNTLDQCANVKRFIYLSSATVYEGANTASCQEEMTAQIPPPSSPIGMAKLAGECAVKLFCKQRGIEYTIWRLFNVVSPREGHAQAGAHVYVDMYRQLFVERVPVLELFGDGKQVRCFTWVEDVAEGMTRFLEDSRAANQTFNLGSDEPVTLLTLRDTLLDVGRSQKLLPDDYRPETKTGGTFFGTEAPKRIPDITKVTQTLDWKPLTPFQDCIEKFVREKTRYAHSSLPPV